MHTFEIEKLNLFYGDKQALTDVSMTIPAKQVTAFIGPSGCGKSTLLRVLNRMNDLIEGVKTQGSVLLEGEGIFGNIDVRQLRMKVGMVFQKPNPFPMSIYDNVAFGQRAQGVSDKKLLDDIVEDALKRAALWDEVKDRLNTSGLGLSGGQQQRLCIARTIAMKPDIILMDEPTSALDPIATTRIEKMMASLREHFTVVIVTHSMSQAKRIADNTAFFLMGELVEYGKTAQIFNQPKDQRTLGYISGDFG